jgi:hypothetical protein
MRALTGALVALGALSTESMHHAQHAQHAFHVTCIPCDLQAHHVPRYALHVVDSRNPWKESDPISVSGLAIDIYVYSSRDSKA